MPMTFLKALAIAVCDAYVDAADAGTTNSAARFIIYKGTVPASVRAALGGDTGVLGTVIMGNPAFGNSADNATDSVAEALANAIADTPAAATGTATFFRLFNRDNVALWQGSVTASGGGGDMELASTSVVAGVSMAVQSYTFRVPY